MKSAIIYYSRTQKTSIVAKAIADKISGDLIEIRDLKNRNGILGWLRAAFDARGDKTTTIEPSSIDTSIYDKLYIGTPVWGGKPTPAINTVMNSFSINEKDIVLFVTLGGSNYKGALEIMENKTKSRGANIVKTFAVVNSGKKDEDEIKTEINNMNL